MSWVTNLLLHVTSRGTEAESDKIVQVNDYFAQMGKVGLIGLDAPELPRGWYGGDKMLEARLYVGAFNYLDLQGFLEHVRGLDWDKGDRVQAFVKEQEEDVFRIIEVVDIGGGPVNGSS